MAGKASPAKMAMMAMTTRSSISVKASRLCCVEHGVGSVERVGEAVRDVSQVAGEGMVESRLRDEG